MPGAADRSYGIQVARLAGIPDSVIDRAKTILDGLENPREESPEDSSTQTKPVETEPKEPESKPDPKPLISQEKPPEDGQMELF